MKSVLPAPAFGVLAPNSGTRPTPLRPVVVAKPSISSNVRENPFRLVKITITTVCFAVEVCTQCKGDLQIPQCKEELQNLSGFTDSSRVTRDPLLFRPNSCETWRRPSKPRRCAHTSHHARCRVMSCEGIGWGRAQIGRQGQARVDPGVSAGIANRSRRFQLGLASSRTQSRVGEVPAVPQCIDDAPFCSSVQSEAARKSGADDRADTWKPRDSPTECKVKLHKQCNRCLQSTVKGADR